MIRQLKRDDKSEVNFVLSSWKHNVKEDYDVIDNLVESRPIFIAQDPEDNNHIFGWMCYGNDRLFYVYVKQAFRRFNIANKLYREALKDMPYVYCPFWSKNAVYLAKKWPLIYNPYLLEELKNECIRRGKESKKC